VELELDNPSVRKRSVLKILITTDTLLFLLYL